jgi:hypothetical protein
MPLTQRLNTLGITEKQAAEVVLSWVVESNTWVHRRVEKVACKDLATIERRVSLDLTIPDSAVRMEGLLWLQIGLLEKKSTNRFSVRSSDGVALPLMSADQAGLFSAAAIVDTARVAGIRTIPVDDLVLSCIRSPQNREGAAACDRVIAAIAAGAGRDNQKERLTKLIREAHENYPLLIAVNQSHRSGDRLLVKYEHASPLDLRWTGLVGRVRQWLAWDTTEIQIETPGIGTARSFHFEFEAPDEVSVSIVALAFIDEKGRRKLTRGRRSTTLAHVHTRDAQRENRRAVAVVSLSPELHHWHTLAISAAAVTSISLVAAAAYALGGQALQTPVAQADAFVALLIAGPSIVLSGFLRPSSSELASRLLRGTRGLGIVGGTTALAAAWGVLLGDGLTSLADALHSLLAIALVLLVMQLLPIVAALQRTLLRTTIWGTTGGSLRSSQGR